MGTMPSLPTPRGLSTRLARPASILVGTSAVSVGLSRVVLGLHYPTDVAAGAVLGGTLAFLSLGIATSFS